MNRPWWERTRISGSVYRLFCRQGRTYAFCCLAVAVGTWGIACPEGGTGFDFDGDGWDDDVDCEPDDPDINPGVNDPYGDGVDQDCDGGDGEDNDADGFPSNVLQSNPDWDCNDFDETINPAAVEVCDLDDQDCDGEIDEGFDADADGYTTCGADGLAGTDDDDCDDTDPAVNPGAVEICNTLDDDCDQSIDEDEDGDGYDVCEDCFDGDATRFDGSTTPGLGDTTWVTICGDTYQMGSLAGNSNEEPLHQVTVPAFEMLQSEVTVAQYGQCGSCGVPSTDTYCNWDEVGYEDHPVNCVTWQQAVDYCTWVGGRLPTESEWEYAARSGGQDITYPWGDEEATCDYAVMDDDNHTYGCDTGRTWSVCSKSPAGDSDQGLCGLSGNVWEWVQDWYHGCYDCSQCPGDWDCDYSTVAPADGMAWEVPSGSERVIRGGGLVHDAFAVRASIRGASGPGGTAIDHGFRCAR